jgi:hypothetical protein
MDRIPETRRMRKPITWRWLGVVSSSSKGQAMKRYPRAMGSSGAWMIKVSSLRACLEAGQ